MRDSRRTCRAAGIEQAGSNRRGRARGVEHAGSSTWSRARGIEYAGSSTWSRARGIEHVGSSTWGRARGIEHAGSSTWGRARGVEHVESSTRDRAALKARRSFTVSSLFAPLPTHQLPAYEWYAHRLRLLQLSAGPHRQPVARSYHFGGTNSTQPTCIPPCSPVLQGGWAKGVRV